MPLFRIGAELHYYAHVPKCAGTAVEEYLALRFGSLALLDRQHMAQPELRQWSKTSPQHVDLEPFERMFPPGWIASSFAVVRHPVARAVSAWRYQREVEGAAPADQPFDDWFAEAEALLAENPFAIDNHLRPQTDMVPDGAVIFPLEHGLDAVVVHLDGLAGDRAVPRRIEHRMPGDKRAVAAPKVAAPGPTERGLARLTDVYAADFRRFGYRPEESAPVAPAKPVDPGPDRWSTRLAVRRLRRRVITGLVRRL